MLADLPVGRFSRYLQVLVPYVVPAVLIWSALGLVLNVVSLETAAWAVAVAYGAYFGAAEVLGAPGVRPPGSQWQVPQTFVLSKRRWTLLTVWGFFLGPGFATRNPYAGFWMLPVLVSAAGHVVLGVVFAALLGAVHATGRAISLLTVASTSDSRDYLDTVLRTMRWRVIDGYLLLIVAGFGAVNCVQRLS